MEKTGSQASKFIQSLVLTERSFVNMYRDKGYYWLRLAIYIALGLGLGTVFLDIGSGYDSIRVSLSYKDLIRVVHMKSFRLHIETALFFLMVQERGSMLMFVASFLTIMAIGGFPSFVEDMKVG